MGVTGSAQDRGRFDYVTVGHVTVDVLADGSRRAGGSALYAALQAARLGLRALIVTRGAVAELHELLSPYRDELALDVQPAAHTTTLTTSGFGSERRQRMLAWAGPIEGTLRPRADILHLAPVARELPEHVDAGAGFVGLTPQGLVREWAALGAEIALGRPDDHALALARRCRALVVSEHERAPCAELIDVACEAGALAAVTAGPRPVRILAAGGASDEVAVAQLERPVDDVGAGDVFAAALFVAMAGGRATRDAVAFAAAAAAVRMAGHGPDAIGDSEAIAARARSHTSG